MTQRTRAVSNSEMKTFKRCERKWYLGTYRRLRKIRTGATGARELGTRVHEALAELYAAPGTQAEDPLVVLERSLCDDIAEFPEQEAEIEKEGELARAMITGYIDWLAEEGMDSGLEVIAPETELIVEAGSIRDVNILFIAKLDVRVRRLTDGMLFFMDHKTVADLTTPLRTLHMDEQMLFYMLVERMGQENTDERTAGGLYNMLKKVKRTGTAKPPFFARQFVTHSDEELRNFWMRVMGTVTKIIEAEDALNAGGNHMFVTPPNPTRDCTWDCDFFAICPMFDDGSNVEGLIETAYEVGDPLARYTTVNIDGTGDNR